MEANCEKPWAAHPNASIIHTAVVPYWCKREAPLKPALFLFGHSHKPDKSDSALCLLRHSKSALRNYLSDSIVGNSSMFCSASLALHTYTYWLCGTSGAFSVPNQRHINFQPLFLFYTCTQVTYVQQRHFSIAFNMLCYSQLKTLHCWVTLMVTIQARSKYMVSSLRKKFLCVKLSHLSELQIPNISK